MYLFLECPKGHLCLKQNVFYDITNFQRRNVSTLIADKTTSNAFECEHILCQKKLYRRIWHAVS